MNRTALLAAASLVASLLLAASASPVRSGEGKPAYIGSKKGQCTKCHNKEAKAWKETSLARSMAALKPATEAADKARYDWLKKAKLDPSKDSSADPKCLRCHASGYGAEGGYPQKPTADDADRVEALGCVGCEACHGAAGGYGTFKNAEKAKDKERKFTKEELAKLGLVLPTAETCKACHNDDIPLKPATPFDFEKARALVHPTKK